MSKGTLRFILVMLAAAASAQGATAIEAWRSADSAARCTLVVPLAAKLDPGEAADILLSSSAATRADWVQRYVLASSILEHTENERWWKERAKGEGKDDRQGEWALLCRKGREVAALLSAAPDWQTRLLAADMLRVFGPDGEPRCLSSLLNDKMWPVRLRAIAALGSSATEESRGLMMRYVRSNDRTERLAAIEACDRIRWVPCLLAGLSDPDAEVQLKSISAASLLLGQETFAGVERERRAMLSALERVSQSSGDQAVRRKALEVLEGVAKQGDMVR
jgi:hypothetical protein